jgi:hypothetical protein
MNESDKHKEIKYILMWCGIPGMTIKGHQIQILNVAGPRATKDPAIHTKASEVLDGCIDGLMD